MPALALAERQLNPRHMEILQALQEMLTSEHDALEEALAEIVSVAPAPGYDFEAGTDPGAVARLQGRVDVLGAIQDARYTWGQVITGMRGFLAFREDALRANTLIYLEQNEVALKRLEAAAAGDLLTFEQTDALDRLVEARAAYVDALHQVFELHGGERAYTDVYLVRSEIGPLDGRAVAAEPRSGARVARADRYPERGTVQHAGETRQSLEEIILNVSTINDTSSSIAAAALEQTHSVDEINRTMASISAIAEQSSQGAQELESSTVKPASVASSLQDLIRTFKIR